MPTEAKESIEGPEAKGDKHPSSLSSISGHCHLVSPMGEMCCPQIYYMRRSG